MPPRIGNETIIVKTKLDKSISVFTLNQYTYEGKYFYCHPWIKFTADSFIADFNFFITELEERRLGKRIKIESFYQIEPDFLFYIKKRAIDTYNKFGYYWIISLPLDLYLNIKVQRNYLCGVQILPLYTTEDFTYAEPYLRFDKSIKLH